MLYQTPDYSTQECNGIDTCLLASIPVALLAVVVATLILLV